MDTLLGALGLSETESKAYQHLLNHGADYPSRIGATIRANRSNVYEALDRLVARGFVSFVTRNKMKWFQATGKEAVIAQIKYKEIELNELKSYIQRLTSPSAARLEASIFVGKNGLRMLFEEMLEAKKPIALIAAELQLKKLFGPYFELWHKQRIERGISQRSIFPKKFKKILENRPLLEYRFVEDQFTNPTTTILFGNTVFFISWAKEPVAVRIDDAEIARSHLNHFDLLWKNHQV